MRRAPGYELYLITDGSAPDRIAGAVAAALRGAPPRRVLVQLRAKGCDVRQLHDIALEIRAHCAAHGAGFIINDRADLAQAAAADGVQLPERALPARAARRILGDEALVGVSCHDAAGLAAAANGGATFATLSPVFPSRDKGQPMGLDAFAALARAASLPVYALGGVCAPHAGALRAAGAAGLAVISAVFAAPEPARAVAELLTAWDAARDRETSHAPTRQDTSG